MAERPATRDSSDSRESRATPGVRSIATSSPVPRASVVAAEVADEVTFSMIDSVLNTPPGTADTRPVQAPVQAQNDSDSLTAENKALKLENEQLQVALASATTQKEEFESRNRVAQSTVDDLKKQVDSLVQQTRSLESDLQDARSQLNFSSTEEATKRAELEGEVGNLRQKLELASQEDSAAVPVAQPTSSGREQELEVERNALREHVAKTQNELTVLQARYAEAQAIIAEQSDLAMRKDVMQSDMAIDLPGESSEDKPLLAAAYQQISVLNTQLAHLYTELTMARTEVQRFRSEQQSGSLGVSQSGPMGDSEAEVLKQSQQIADLVSDIRHLQLDLEYHQQKLDQMIEEKQQMMRDMKRSQAELEETKRQVEERDQMLKHREVDLKQLKDEMRSPRAGGPAGPGASQMEGDGTLAALRAEAAAKDSALIVSHYELHKEKLLRDRLEQKNLKLMERMQKLMMVVETMRKENVTLERNLVAKEQSCESREQQLRQVTQKAKQLQKIAKAAKTGQKGGSKTVLELQQALPPLERSQRSMDSSGGRRSGASTPRTPRTSASPYGTR